MTEFGVLRCTVTDVFKWSGENHEQEYGISVIVPLPFQTPRHASPTFGGESRTTGIYVKVSIFRHKLHGKNNHEVERFLHLKVIAKPQKDGSLEWEWSTSYGINDLCDDPKTTNTYYGEVEKIEQDQFKCGFKYDEHLTSNDFSEQFKPSIKAIRQNRGECMGNMSTLCCIETQSEVPDGDNVLYLKDTFPEPEWFAEMIATCPELAMHELDKHYSALYKAKTENEEFGIGYIEACAELIVEAVDFIAVGNHEKAVKVIMNCNCGRLEAHCHGKWIMDKIVGVAQEMASKAKRKGMETMQTQAISWEESMLLLDKYIDNNKLHEDEAQGDEEEQSSILSYEVVTTGRLPYKEDDFDDFLRTKVKDVCTPSKDIDIIIVGKEFNQAILDEQINLRRGQSLFVYSQEMFLSRLAGKDPYDDKDALMEFAEGHPVFEYLDKCFFTWKTTHIVPSKGGTVIIDLPPKGVFDDNGYHVGNAGVERNERHRILTKVFKTKLNNVTSLEYMAEWGTPNSGERLKKMADSIASFACNAKRKNNPCLQQAIDDWEQDLDWLRETYYNGRFSFDWRSTFVR